MGCCALCKSEADLIDSHLIPKSAYKHLRGLPENGGGSPIRIDGGQGNASQSDLQITQYLLCRVCEDLFSKHGEKVIGRLWGTHSGFPLVNQLLACEVRGSHEGYSLHDHSVLDRKDVDGLIYFALSIFWRAHVWNWTGKTDPYKKALGSKYEQEIREFLLGLQSLGDMLLMLNVNTNAELNSFARLPQAYRKNGVTHHVFSLLGIEFSLFLGGSISPEQRSLMGQDKVLFATSDIAKTNVFNGLSQFVQTKISVKGKLKDKMPIRARGSSS
ncbi:hypothetical protein [Pseudomonas sp. JR33AA]|uniref:hypothetical protein n=1 Tax=Pseudomonas sp. JR33AA TaxID=2899113 RepID=UPI001F3BB52D|nr:hypothetical protein [Pseudomonas sp. JR33AA]MCE5979093.1 hypothetical protein [Pseudomonas sp. JR33AA]